MANRRSRATSTSALWTSPAQPPVAVCEQQPATAAALSEVRVVFGTGTRRRSLHRVWGGGEADEPLPMVEIAAIGGLSPAETCHVLLHELAHVLAPGAGHGKAWRYAAR